MALSSISPPSLYRVGMPAPSMPSARSPICLATLALFRATASPAALRSVYLGPWLTLPESLAECWSRLARPERSWTGLYRSYRRAPSERARPPPWPEVPCARLFGALSCRLSSQTFRLLAVGLFYRVYLNSPIIAFTIQSKLSIMWLLERKWPRRSRRSPEPGPRERTPWTNTLYRQLAIRSFPRSGITKPTPAWMAG